VVAKSIRLVVSPKSLVVRPPHYVPLGHDAPLWAASPRGSPRLLLIAPPKKLFHPAPFYPPAPDLNGEGPTMHIRGSGIQTIPTVLGHVTLAVTSIPMGSANGSVLGTPAIVTTVPLVGTPVWAVSDPSGTFQINASTGVVSVLNNATLGGLTPIPITISVNGVAPAAQPGNFTITISPNFLEADFSHPLRQPWAFW
jgi:hypothetical protein